MKYRIVRRWTTKTNTATGQKTEEEIVQGSGTPKGRS